MANTLQINDEVSAIRKNVRITEQSIAEGKQQLKTLNEQIKELVEGLLEAETVAELQAQLKEAQQALKQRLMANQRYNDLMEKRANIAQDVKDDEEVLSSHLVAFYGLTQDRQIELDESNGDSREVILTGKLGKEQKYQTSMFSKGVKA